MSAVKSDINCYVLAGPGAGKTELLAQRACYLLQTNKCVHPRRILSISFKRDAAANIARRVRKRCGDELARRFSSFTYDAFAKRIFDQFRNSLPAEYLPNPQYDVLVDDNEILHAFELLERRIYNAYQRREIIGTFDGIAIPFIREEPRNELESAAINVQRSFIKGTKGLSSKLTFKMITRLSKSIILNNQAIRKALRITYSHVFLDEFQDTTSLQYSFVTACFYDSKSVLTAVGDDKQRIMVWAGADREIFTRYKKDFRAEKYSLTVNHRSAPRLIQLQEFLAGQMIGDDDNKVTASDRWDEKDGDCEIWNYLTPDDEAQDLANSIEQWIKEDGLKPREISILVRQRPEKYTEDLIVSLKSKGILARNESQLQDLLAEDAVRVILNYLYAMLSKKARQEWIDLLDLLKYFRGILGYDDSSNTQAIIIERELSDSMQVAGQLLGQVTDNEKLEDLLWSILNIFDVQSFKNHFPHYRRGNYLKELFVSTARHIWKEYEAHRDWLKAVQSFCGELSIPIMTIHKSKGLEYDTVVFVGLEDSAIWNFPNQQDEETCTFFVGLSRAKRRVIFTFSNIRNTGFNGSPQAQSRNKLNPLYEILRNSGIVTEYNK